MAIDKDVVVVGAVRTPFGRFGGSLANIDYYELGAIPMREVIKRVGVKPGVVNEVFWGVGDTSACRDPYTPVAARQSPITARRPPLLRPVADGGPGPPLQRFPHG